MRRRMVATLAVSLFSAATAWGQTRLDLRSQVKNVDFSAAIATKPFKTGASLPPVCTVGEAFFKTDAPEGTNWYGCTAENVWTLQSGTLAGKDVSSLTPANGDIMRWNAVAAQWTPQPMPASVVSSGQVTDLQVSLENPTTLKIAAGRWGIGPSTFKTPEITVSIRSMPVSGATNTSPITVTVPSVTGLASGDTVQISDVQGNTTANGVWTILIMTGTTLQLQGSAGSGAYTGGGTLGGRGNGTAYIYANDSGNINIDHEAGAALVIGCTDRCIYNQVTSPSFPANASPLAVVTISDGKWTAVDDRRRFLTSVGVAAGPGIAVEQIGGSHTIGLDASVPRLAKNNIWIGDNSFTAATRTAPCRTGNGAPLSQNGTTGDCYFQSDAAAGQNLWLATQSGTPAVWARAGAAAPTGVTPGTYANPVVTISADGRITSASAGTAVTGSAKLDWQKRRGDVPVAAGADAEVYSTSLPADTLHAGECLRITAQVQQMASAAPYDYKLWLGSTSVTVSAANNSQAVLAGAFQICNDPGSDTSQQLTGRMDWGAGGSSGTTVATAAEDTRQPLTVRLTARAAGGSPVSVTPWGWLVEIVRQ